MKLRDSGPPQLSFAMCNLGQIGVVDQEVAHGFLKRLLCRLIQEYVSLVSGVTKQLQVLEALGPVLAVRPSTLVLLAKGRL